MTCQTSEFNSYLDHNAVTGIVVRHLQKLTACRDKHLSDMVLDEDALTHCIRL